MSIKKIKNNYLAIKNGEKVDEVEMPEMHISTFSLSETFDAGTPVSNKYRTTNHYPYTGEWDKVVVRLLNSSKGC